MASQLLQLSSSVPTDSLRLIRRRLLTWFDRHRRDLPWRHVRDPYRIWISEVMLQQTQVTTVIPYYKRFLKAFPDVFALAAADEQDVLRQWEGLGYYRRARHLHQAARQLVTGHGGHLPNDPDIWRELPGIGRYTLGAILSQAFDRRLPILEANSIRVLCRLFGVRQSPKLREVQHFLWEMAEKLVPAKRAGDFNQALMEVGALVCAPTSPACGRCPLTGLCEARKRGMQATIPSRPPAQKTVTVDEVAVVVRRGRRVLVVQRPDMGRWAGLWEFPHDSIQNGETHLAAATRMLSSLTGVAADLGAELTTLTHSITRYAVKLVCLSATYRDGEFLSPQYRDARWIAPARLSQLPFSAPQRRLAQLLLARADSRSRSIPS